MKRLKKYIPEGMRDLLFQQCESKNFIVQSLRNFYKARGFEEISSPTLEYFDVFYGDNTAMEQEDMYKLLDARGKLLVLRPDMTIPIVRIASTKLKNAAFPLRVFYNGNIFRTNDFWEGKVSEITQSGIEIIGNDNTKGDTEVIITAIKALLQVGVNNFHIEIGQAEFFKALIEDTTLDYENMNILRGLIEKKNFIALKEFIEINEGQLGSSSEALKALPTLFGDRKVLEKARTLTNNEKALESIKDIEEIYNNIENMALDNFVSIDLGMVQYINYYTGITFKGYSSDLGCDIVSGGRYDNLGTEFGSIKSATGFALNVDNIMETLEKQGVKQEVNKKVLIDFSPKATVKAYETADSLRQEGIIAELALFETKEQGIDYGREKGFYKIIYISETGDVQEIYL